jgi:phosphoribosylaminoimidazole carboxylase
MTMKGGLFSVIGPGRGGGGGEDAGNEGDDDEEQQQQQQQQHSNKPSFVVACIGGGQLGRMMALEAPRLGIQMKFLDPLGHACPASHVVPSHCIVKGSLNDANAIRQLARGANVVTVEIEHVNVDALWQLEQEQPQQQQQQEQQEQQEQQKVNVQPSARVLRIIQDKFLQKQHFATHGIAVPPFVATPSVQAIMDATSGLGLPLMLKTRRGGYDGRGNAVLKSNKKEHVLVALQQLGISTKFDNDNEELSNRNDLDIYAEGWIDFDCEVAVMVVRSAAANADVDVDATDTATDTADHHPHPTTTTTTTVSYPAVNAIQQDSICRVVLAPARNVSESLRNACQDLAVRAIDSLGTGASGTFGVEMFITKQQGQGDVVLLNEVAPRPHNTGHYTQDACAVSQFENHLRGICGLPLGNTQMLVEAAAMVNILGSANMQDTLASSNLAMTSLPNAVVHWYGKDSCRPGRKMGHINITGHSHGEIDAALLQLMQAENIPVSLLPNYSSSNSSSSSSSSRCAATARNSSSSSSNSGSSACPVVGVIMGSQSDLPTMQEAVVVLQQFHIPYQVDIVSAHRTPDKLLEYSRSAAGRGIRVIIAGAGGAAHLPGMVAAMTPLPVIGVPVKTTTLNGVDSLYSIVQMPKGVPVATVAIGNAANAGLLAVRILATSRPHLRLEMIQYQTEMKDMVLETSARLLELGSDEYLKQMDNKNKSVNI